MLGQKSVNLRPGGHGGRRADTLHGKGRQGIGKSCRLVQIHSLRHLPAARRREHISLLRQHRVGQDSTTGPIRHYIQRNIAYKEGSTTATVHLALIYAPGDTNEIDLPLIWKDHRWWRR